MFTTTFKIETVTDTPKVLTSILIQDGQLHANFDPCRGRLLGIIGRDPSLSKSNQLHVHVFGILFMDLRYNSLDSSKTIDDFPEVLNFNQLFLKLKWFICN